VPGQQVVCPCTNGLTGAQACNEEGTFDRCTCDYAVPGAGGSLESGGTVGGGSGGTFGGGSGGDLGGTGGSLDGGIGGGTGGTGGTGAASGGQGGTGGSPGEQADLLSEGPSRLIDVFVGELGYYIVTSTELALVDRDREDVGRLTLPREATAATFDGERLVIFDGATLTGFSPELDELGSGQLVEACASAVAISKSRVVCGANTNVQRVFYTYSARTFEVIATSAAHTYIGIPMKLVPGTDDFVTVSTDSSPSDFHLYTVSSGSTPRYLGESPYHGDFGVTGVYAFDAAPPTHLITHRGLMLTIYTDDCTTEALARSCFMKDGELGTLRGNEVFIGMDSDASGTLHTLTHPADSPFSQSGSCVDKACIAQHIDVASRTVLDAKLVEVPAGVGEVVALRQDPFAGGMVFGFRVGATYPFRNDPYPGHRVERVRFR
jgi:hypothetical protein